MPHSPIRNLTRCAVFSALLCVCGWISIPLPGISMTLQTFGIFLALGVLGGAAGIAACGVYLLLGLAGLPVFSGFQSGISAFLGPTGGYLWGFLLSGLIYWTVTAISPRLTFMAMVAGLLGCYFCGTCWYAFGYLNAGFSGVPAALMSCVVPYVIPDIIKLLLAHRLSIRLKRFIR